MSIPDKKIKFDWWFYVIPVLVALFALFHYGLFTSRGELRLVIYYLGPMLISVLAILFFIIGIIHASIKRPFYNRKRLLSFGLLLLFPISFFVFGNTNGNMVSAYPSAYANYKSKVNYRLPLDNPITVAWGGNTEDVNYHVAYPDQRWAYDLFVTKNNSSFTGSGTKVEDYYCYNLPVLSPAAGKVVVVYDKMQNVKPGELGAEPAHGNHIILETASNEYLVLCHLKPKSILVKEGDIVNQGQELARVGNTGNTSEPHLHLHLQNNKDVSFGEGLPLYFNNYYKGTQYIAKGMPQGGIGSKGNFKGDVVRNAR
jgi:murein DD-endopeptidase MepM/ murein hydrolase activator NlpD